MYELLTQIGLPIALIFIMTGVGLGLTESDFLRVFAQPKAFLIGGTCQLLLLPLTAWGIIELLNLEGELAIGLIILALCPGGTTSNLYSYLARADLGLSVSLTSVIGLFAPFTLPIIGSLAIAHYSGANTGFELPLFRTWLQLMLVSVVPVIIGMLIRRHRPLFAARMEPVVTKVSALVLALVIVTVCSELGVERLQEYMAAAGVATLLLNIITMSAGYFVGRWLLSNEAQARTLCLEIGLQNGTMALMITVGILKSAEMSIAPSMYSIVMFISATLFTMLVLRADKRRALTKAAA